MWVELDYEALVTGPTYPRDSRDPRLQPTPVKRFPPYVFGTGRSNCVVHQSASAALDWWIIVGPRGERVQRAKAPRLLIRTVCGALFSINGSPHRPPRAQTCATPAPGALVCRACQRAGRNFPRRLKGKDVDAGLTRSEAHTRLGCATPATPVADPLT